MGVKVHSSTTKAYYFAYPIGLFLSFMSYWLFNYISPPPLRFPLSEWREPVDYIRPEERGVVEGQDTDEIGRIESGEEAVEKGGIRVGENKALYS